MRYLIAWISFLFCTAAAAQFPAEFIGRPDTMTFDGREADTLAPERRIMMINPDTSKRTAIVGEWGIPHDIGVERYYLDQWVNDDTLWTNEIQRAIDTISARTSRYGMAELVIPPGTYYLDTAGVDPYYTGTDPNRQTYCIELKDNVRLRIEPGATIALADSMVTYSDSTMRVNMFIGDSISHVWIGGGGTIDGNAGGQYQEAGGYYGQTVVGNIFQLYGDDGFDNTHIVFDDLILRNHSGNPLNIENSRNIYANQVVTTQMGEGMQFIDCTEGYVNGYSVSDTAGTQVGDGFELSGCTDFMLTGLFIKGGGNGQGSAVDLFGSDGVILDRFIIDDWKNGISAEATSTVGENSYSIIVSNGYLNGRDSTGTAIRQASGSIFYDNLYIRNWAYGFESYLSFSATGITDLTVLSNVHIDSCDSGGMRLEDSTNVYVFNSTIQNCIYGVRLDKQEGDYPYLEWHGGRIVGTSQNVWCRIDQDGDAGWTPRAVFYDTHVEGIIQHQNLAGDGAIEYSIYQDSAWVTNRQSWVKDSIRYDLGTTTAGHIIMSDAFGNMRWQDTTGLFAGGGGGTNIYLADGSLAGNRTVTMGGNDLTFTGLGSGSDYTITGTGQRDVTISSSDNNAILQLTGQTSTQLHMTENDVSREWIHLITNGDYLIYPNTDDNFTIRNAGAAEDVFQVNLASKIVQAIDAEIRLDNRGDASNAGIGIYADNGNTAALNLYNGSGQLKWAFLRKATNFDFTISRYVSGVFQDNPIDISNSTGEVTFANDVEFDSDILDINASAGTAGQVLSSLGAGNGIDWVDASGGSGGWNNIYNADSSLAGNRAVNMQSFNIDWNNAGSFNVNDGGLTLNNIGDASNAYFSVYRDDTHSGGLLLYNGSSQLRYAFLAGTGADPFFSLARYTGTGTFDSYGFYMYGNDGDVTIPQNFSVDPGGGANPTRPFEVHDDGTAATEFVVDVNSSSSFQSEVNVTDSGTEFFVNSTARPWVFDISGTDKFEIGNVNIISEANHEFNSTLTDINGDVGTSGQILSSTGIGVDWIDDTGGSDTHIANANLSFDGDHTADLNGNEWTIDDGVSVVAQFDVGGVGIMTAAVPGFDLGIVNGSADLILESSNTDNDASIFFESSVSGTGQMSSIITRNNDADIGSPYTVGQIIYNKDNATEDDHSMDLELDGEAMLTLVDNDDYDNNNHIELAGGLVHDRIDANATNSDTLDQSYYIFNVTSSVLYVQLPEIADSPTEDQVKTGTEFIICNRSGANAEIRTWNDTGTTNDDYFNGVQTTLTLTLADNESIRVIATRFASSEGDWSTFQ